MRTVDLSNPNELRVITGWLQETRIRMVRNVLFGSAAVIGALGLGVAASIWALDQHGTSPEERAADLKTALAELAPLKVEPVKLAADASVRLTQGGIVSLDRNAKVELAQPAEVRLADPARVTLDASGFTLPPAASSASTAPTKTLDGEAIKTSVTMFQSVDFEGGEVATGWVFPSGKATTPTRQYCYLKRPDAGSRGDRESVTYLAYDRKPTGNGTSEMVSRCVWWKG